MDHQEGGPWESLPSSCGVHWKCAALVKGVGGECLGTARTHASVSEVGVFVRQHRDSSKHNMFIHTTQQHRRRNPGDQTHHSHRCQQACSLGLSAPSKMVQRWGMEVKCQLDPNEQRGGGIVCGRPLYNHCAGAENHHICLRRLRSRSSHSLTS